MSGVRVSLGWGLVGWTLFVWGSRARNLINDDELAGWALIWRSGAAAMFLAGALLGAGLLLKKASFVRQFFAGWSIVGIGWWTIRGIQTLVGDFSVAFKAVHTVLALVTIVLGLLILRQGADQAEPEPSLGRRAVSR